MRSLTVCHLMGPPTCHPRKTAVFLCLVAVSLYMVLTFNGSFVGNKNGGPGGATKLGVNCPSIALLLASGEEGLLVLFKSGSTYTQGQVYRECSLRWS